MMLMLLLMMMMMMMLIIMMITNDPVNTPVRDVESIVKLPAHNSAVYEVKDGENAKCGE